MPDPSQSSRGGMPLHIYAQILMGVAVQLAIFWRMGVYWGICATPLAFATFAAVNLTDLDSHSERRIKTLLTWITFGSIAAAVVSRMILIRL